MTTGRNSRIYRATLLIIIIFSLSLPAYAKYSGGTGEPNDPYQIATAVDLIALGENPGDYDKHFILTADIDMNPKLLGRKVFDKAVIALEHAYDDPEVFGGTSFSGNFDGQDYVISNLQIQGSRYLGLFGRLEIGAVISNLGLEAVDVNGTGSYIGGLVGCNLGSEIATCYSSGTVNGGAEVGGLAGYNSSDSSIYSSYSSCMVRGEWFDVGGLVGKNSGNITSSFCTGAVSAYSFDVGGLVGENSGSISLSFSTGTVIGEDDVGGLVGSNEANGSITACFSTGTVSGDWDLGYSVGSWDVGGLVGENEGSITASYSTGSVSGDLFVGGLVGGNRGSIYSSYSTGAVSGNDYIGGLVGSSGYISDSFWDIQTSGLQISDGGIGLTTAQMMDPNVYSLNGWAGEPNWVLDSGKDYPRLMWEDKAGQTIPEPNIDWFDGSGTQEDPYIIATADQLARIGTASIIWDKAFVLISDLDLSDINFPRIGVCPGTDFTGIFDGDNHVVSNLTMGSDLITVSYFGLFGYVGRGGRVRCLNLQNATIKIGLGSKRVGILAGVNKGNINDCCVTGSVSSGYYYIGGLAGENSGIIANCCSTVSVSGGDFSRFLGGLVGTNSSEIYSCYAEGSVTGGNNSMGLGGLVGLSDNSNIINSYAATSISSGNMSSGLGGLVGTKWDGSIENCYAIGRVSSGNESFEIGGLVGKDRYQWPGPIEDTISQSFWAIETSGQTTSDGGIVLTTAKMQDIQTYLNAGWDFVDESDNGLNDVWQMPRDTEYPILTTFSNEYQPRELAGLGTSEYPYQIVTVEDLAAMNHYDPSACYKLVTNIDLSGATLTVPLINYFDGTFDGNGLVVSNLTMHGEDNLGLFGILGEYSVILNLGIEDANIVGTDYLGSLAATNKGSITMSYNTGSVSGNQIVGGLAGKNYGSIMMSYGAGTVTGDGWDVGGIVGQNSGGLRSCYSRAEVNGDRFVGGMVGRNGGSISSGYSTGRVSGDRCVGGLVGSNNGPIRSSYSTGAVSGNDYSGGLVGITRGVYLDYVSSSFWDIETSGQTTSVGGTGKSTAEMQTAGTFLEVGWDFVDETANGTEDIWWILEGRDYPRLWWETFE